MQPYQQHLLKAYDRRASQYKDASAIIQEIGERLISRLTYFRHPPQEICDLGAGQGFDTELLQHVYPSASVVSVDFSLSQLHHIAPQKLRCAADAMQLPFAAKSFDLVFANLSMPAIIDYAAFWEEILRVLKPGGIFLFSSLGPQSLFELRQSLMHAKSPDSMNTFPEIREVGDGLVKAGFKDPAIDAENLELRYSTLKKLLVELKNLGSVKMWGNYSHLYPGKRFWQHVENFYRENFLSENQKLIATLEIYFGIAFAPTEIENAQLNNSIPISSIQRRKK